MEVKTLKLPVIALRFSDPFVSADDCSFALMSAILTS